MASASILSLTLCTLLGLALLTVLLSRVDQTTEHLPWTPLRDRSAGNSTLGFEAILAICLPKYPPGHLWRKSGLLDAAERSDLSITILDQPNATVDQKDPVTVVKTNEHTENRLSAWLGHLHALRRATSLSSALILEDDQDWDVLIRSAMPQIAEAVRKVSSGSLERDKPYGSGWDVLWLGHCGERLEPTKPWISFKDRTVPPFVVSEEPIIAPDPYGLRYVQAAVRPLCTFAYAVTNSGASKILALPGKSTGSNGVEGFDVWLQSLCMKQLISCFSVNPELFHEHEMPGWRQSLINGASEDEYVEREKTNNIWHSSRCNVNTSATRLVQCMGPDPRL